MTEWSKTLDRPTLLVGDFNVAPLESDVWNHKQLLKVVSHTPIEVEALDTLQKAHDWVDLGRHFIPAPERYYSWWSYRAKDWADSDRGRRLDHMWASPELAEKAVSHTIHEPCRGWFKPSDHVPLVTEFRV
jgi:exodeoxyribonuclease-3